MVQKKSRSGLQITVEMLNALPADHRERLLASVAEKDPELVEELRKRLFTFEDLARLEDVLIQKILREVPTKKLALALRGASDPLKEAVYRNLSSRAGETLREEV